MVSRNIRTVITIGGSVAGSLPSSTKRAVAELNRLKTVQAADIQEANRLRTAIRGLSKGTDEYKLRAQQLREVQERINLRVDEIGRVGVAARNSGRGVGSLTNRFAALRAGVAPVGLALGAVTGLVVALGAAFGRAGAEANDILITSGRFGITAESFQRGAVYMRTFTQDAGRARQQFETLLQVGQDFERVRFGEQLDPRRFLAATRLGINVNDLIQGRLDPTQLFERVAAGFADLAPEEARLRAEVLLGPELAALAAGVAEGNLSVEEANRRANDARILSEEQLQANQAMGQNIDEIRQRISELLTAVVSRLIPYTLTIASAIADKVVPLAEFLLERLGGPPTEAESQSRLEELYRQIAQLQQAGERPDSPILAPLLRERNQLQEDLRGGFAQAREQQLSDTPTRILDVVTGGQITGDWGRRIYRIDQQIEQWENTVFGGIGRGVESALEGVGRRALEGSTFGLPPNLTGRQFGGRVQPGEMTLVGERGPEIAQFPGGTNIIPNERIREFVRRESPGPTSRAGSPGQPLVSPISINVEPMDSGRRDAPPPTPPPAGMTTVSQTFYVTIVNPADTLDIERSLQEAAGRVGANTAGG